MLRLVVLLAGVGAALVGCAAEGTGEFRVPAGRYAAAFDATRDVLRDYRLPVERVDAAQGVITSADKASAGWATPWDVEQTTAAQETSDLFNQQRRRVRVTFDPPGTDPDQPVIGRVQVTVMRVQAPGVRLNPRSVQLTTTARDPALTARQVWGQYDLPVTRDSALEARLARAIERRLDRPPAR